MVVKSNGKVQLQVRFEMFYSGVLEHERGVAVTVDFAMGKTITGNWRLSDRILLLNHNVEAE